MDFIQVVSLVLGSSLLSAFVSSFVTKRNNDNNNSLKYITEERQKWRSLIKETTATLIASNDLVLKKKSVVRLQLSLNPSDENDKRIVFVANQLLTEDDNTKLQELTEKLLELTSKLLKHDWERAKLEAKGSFWPLKISIYTVLIWIFVKKILYNTNLIVALQKNDLLHDLFTRICITIIVLELLYIMSLWVDKWAVKKRFMIYKNCREKLFNGLGLPVRISEQSENYHITQEQNREP